jgi:hypothetical protein
LLFFFSSASVWFFSFWSLVGVELLVAFRRCGGGCWPVELLWGGDGGSSPLYAEA